LTRPSWTEAEIHGKLKYRRRGRTGMSRKIKRIRSSR
jgi:hypothetical protein